MPLPTPTIGFNNDVLDIIGADEVFFGTIAAEAVYFGDQRIWHRNHTLVINGSNDVKGDHWMRHGDAVRYHQLSSDGTNTVYFECGGKIMTFPPMPPYNITGMHKFSGSSMYQLIPDYGFGNQCTTFNFRTTMNAYGSVQPGYDVSHDKILATIHYTPPPVIHHNAGHPQGPITIGQQQEVTINFGNSWDHFDEIFYFYNDTKNAYVSLDYIDLGGLSLATTDKAHWYINWADGVHTFKFWAESAGDHISLRIGMYGPAITADSKDLQLIIS